MSNLDSIAIAELLGHEDVDTTKIYIHLSKNNLKNSITETNYAKSIMDIMK